jgi:hypothetical protein
LDEDLEVQIHTEIQVCKDRVKRKERKRNTRIKEHLTTIWGCTGKQDRNGRQK